MVCQSTSLQEQAQLDTVRKKASHLPLLPCSNAASSPAQKVFNFVLTLAEMCVETINQGVDILNK